MTRRCKARATRRRPASRRVTAAAAHGAPSRFDLSREENAAEGETESGGRWKLHV